MNAPEKIKEEFLPDVQAQKDTRSLAIQKAGVRGIKYPFSLKRNKIPFRWLI